MSSCNSRSDAGISSESGAGAIGIRIHPDFEDQASKIATDNAGEEGDCSDSDALLSTPRHRLSPDPTLSLDIAGMGHFEELSSASERSSNNNEPAKESEKENNLASNSNSQLHYSTEDHNLQAPLPSTMEQTEGLFPIDILNNPPFVSHDTPSVSSTPSSNSNSSSEATGLVGIRRFVRSRASARTRTTAESSSSRFSTQSLGDEDLFALTLNGEDPRLGIAGTTLMSPRQSSPPQQTSSQRALWDAARMHSSGHFPPIVWEESSDSDHEAQHHRRRTFSEPSGNRLRNFLYPIPGVRRRGSRQSSSVRRHLPRSSSSPNATMLAASPLSTTAAAVLFTSSQASHASIDSLQESALSPHRLGRSRHASPHRPNGSQLRMSSHSLDDSARAGMGTSHQSIVLDGTGADALSISTIGNSTVARSDPAAVLGQTGTESQPTGTHLLESNDAPEDGGGNDETATDRSREARVRWVRINQRFQLMITFVAICFSLLLFSILISWIIMSSAYVVTFEKECDIPLKFFYWLVTLQLVLDIFRNDITKHILRWDPAAQPPGTAPFIPARVVAYNIGYMTYALLVLKLGVDCVFINGQQPESTCRHTSPELFQSSLVYVTLTLAAWATIVLGYLVPFCFVATLLTLNGYNPRDDDDVVGVSPIPGGVFPNAYSHNGAPPGTIEQMREVDLDECPEQECCICMEDFRSGRHNADDAIVQTDCGHTLHKNCCNVWLRQARTCPVCRSDIPNAQAERLRQEQAELGEQSDANQNLEQGQREERHPAISVQQLAPMTTQLAFRPAGRQEIVTLIRALRQPRHERQENGSRRATDYRTPNASERSRRSISNQSTGNAGSNQMEHSHGSRQEDLSNHIEITALRRRVDSFSNTTLRANEGRLPNDHPTTRGSNDEAHVVL